VSGSIVDKSLVLMEHDRFSMLETIHEYARERLAGTPEADEVRRRHAAHFISVAERTEAKPRCMQRTRFKGSTNDGGVTGWPTSTTTFAARSHGRSRIRIES
jgi:hypothetical protein